MASKSNAARQHKHFAVLIDANNVLRPFEDAQKSDSTSITLRLK
jgi:hypothetical protein